MRYLITLTLITAVATASAQEIEGPEAVEEHRLVRLELTGLADGDSAIWDAFAVNDRGNVIEADGGSLNAGLQYWFTGPPGNYRVTATYLSDGKLGQDRQYVTIGEGPEPGPDPTPPGPEPVPPEPEPAPDDAPFPADGLAVLIVYETGGATDLADGHRAILFGRETRDFLDTATGDQYRIWDTDTDVSEAEPPWGAAMDVERASLPWVVLSDGETGTSQALPASVDEFKALVQEYK